MRRGGVTFLFAVVLIFGLPGALRAATVDWRISAVGDIMLDRDVRTKIDRVGLAALVAPVRSMLKGNVVIGNLEGPFTTNRSVARNTYLNFTFDPKWAPELQRLGFTHLSLANNHTLNFGTAGLASTKKYLLRAKLRYFGEPSRTQFTSRIVKMNGTRVALIGYHGLSVSIDDTLAEIERLKARVDLIVVVPHWGAEYKLGIQPRLQQQARRLIDAGADIILGGHPHVIEPIEIYKGRLIAYSLGNFIFDQYWSTETQQGLVVSLTKIGKKLVVRLKPVVAKQAVVSPASPSVRTNILNRMADASVVTESQRRAIRTGVLVLNYPARR